MTRRCLIVDPSAMVRRVAARIVRELDFEIIEARSGQEALDSCAGTLPQVVMLEAALSDMSSTEFMTQLAAAVERDGADHPTVMFCTAERDVPRIVQALQDGADEYIMKPFDSDIIISKFAIAGLIDADHLNQRSAA